MGASVLLFFLVIAPFFLGLLQGGNYRNFFSGICLASFLLSPFRLLLLTCLGFAEGFDRKSLVFCKNRPKHFFRKNSDFSFS